MTMKYLVVVGGVISGIGKGILTSSCGVLLKSMGYTVTAIKIDPYLNIDAGLMNPSEHGEVFVLNDGGEVDLDLGNYERFLDINLTSKNSITTGKIYKKVIDDERQGRFLGKTVQVVPHITNEIQRQIEETALTVTESGETPDFCTIELGGTIGDIESAPFVEALRQFKKRVGPENFCLIQVTLIPGTGADQKSKPTQSSVRDLRGLGLIPDIIACRCKDPLNDEVRDKISLFCDVEKTHILSFHDCKTIYDVPILLKSQNLDEIFIKKYTPDPGRVMNINNLSYYDNWRKMAQKFTDNIVGQDRTVNVCIVGKYTKTTDAYFSISKALEHASADLGVKVNVSFVESTDFEPPTEEDVVPKAVNAIIAWKKLGDADGVLVPGGFGGRGVEGKMFAIKYARENNIPLFGICFGMQLSVIEFARNVLKLKDSNTTEINPDCKNKVVIDMPEIKNQMMGGTQRLGVRDTILTDSCVKTVYNGKEKISERHRHRYEVNPEYVQRLEAAGLKFVGKDTKQERMEIIELDDHPFFVGTQFHPEYLSRPLKPAPLFVAFVKACYENKVDANVQYI